MCADVAVSPAARGIAGRISEAIVLSLGLCSRRQLQTDWLGEIRCSKSPPFIWSTAIGIPSPFLILTFGKGEQVRTLMCCSPYLTSTSGTRKRNELTDSTMWTEIEREGGGLTVDGDIQNKLLSHTTISMCQRLTISFPKPWIVPQWFVGLILRMCLQHHILHQTKLCCVWYNLH